MLNSRIINTLILIVFFTSMIIGAIFYYKKVNTNLISTEYGDVNLGEIYSERVIIHVKFKNLMNDSNKFEEFTELPYFNAKKTLTKHMEGYIDSLNTNVSKENQINYSEASPKQSNVKIELDTAVEYYSSNYRTTPFILGIETKQYDLLPDKLLQNSINHALDDNYIQTKENITSTLFLTNKETRGLEDTNDSYKLKTATE